MFVLPADARRDGFLASVREMVARENGDPAWREGPGADVKLLVIVHRMAAARLGFGDLYAAMNDRAPTGFGEGPAIGHRAQSAQKKFGISGLLSYIWS